MGSITGPQHIARIRAFRLAGRAATALPAPGGGCYVRAMLTDALRALVSAATGRVAERAGGHDRTVVAALLTRSGRTILGPTLDDSLGGPCAEASALATHAASCPEDPVVALAAVAAPGDVVAPCGTCRQILFETDPAIVCVVRTSAGLEPLTAADLLPHAHLPGAESGVQRINMWEWYEGIVRDGSKRQTIRIDDPFRPGPALIVFDKAGGGSTVLGAVVDSVVPVARRDLTEEIARRDGFADLAELNAALDRHYPGLGDDALTDVVTFRLSGEA